MIKCYKIRQYDKGKKQRESGGMDAIVSKVTLHSRRIDSKISFAHILHVYGA